MPSKTVKDLLTCAALYELTRGLFPYNEIMDIDESSRNKESEAEDETKEEETVGFENEKEESSGEKEENSIPGDGATEDLPHTLAKLAESQDDVELDEHITESIKNLTSDTSQENSKEEEIIDEIIENNLSKIDDSQLEERITYCKKHAQRILTAVKKGQNPQIVNSESIDTRPITNDEIEDTIKLALQEPFDDEQDNMTFPELPKTIPGDIQNKESQDQPEIEDDEAEDLNTAEYVAHHHENTTHSKPIPKQLKKEDIRTFLEDGELLERATKCAKFGISAMNYEDIDTAMAELNKSIDLLKQLKDRQE